MKVEGTIEKLQHSKLDGIERAAIRLDTPFQPTIFCPPIPLLSRLCSGCIACPRLAYRRRC